MTKIACALTTLVSLSALAGAAHAQDLRVRYDDLDLARPSDARVFQARVEDAATQGCTRVGALQGAAQWSCMATVRTDMLQQLPTTVRADYVKAVKVRPSTQIASAR